MIGKLFGKAKNADGVAGHAAGGLPLAVTRARTVRVSADDPLAVARVAGQEVFHRLFAAMKNDRGVHVESMLCVLGALAGYACQAEVRAIARAKGLADADVFQFVTAADGRRYYFGDMLNAPLLTAEPSLWGIVGAAATAAGAASLPDAHAVFRHAAATIGAAGFGVPRVPAKHQPGQGALAYLKQSLPVLFPLVRGLCPDPAAWPVVFGLAIVRTIEAAGGAIDPVVAFTIAMDAAVAMSKVDLGGV